MKQEMSKFENWICNEMSKIHELHEIFCELGRLNERLSKFKHDSELRYAQRCLGIISSTVLNYEAKLNSNHKIACAKHQERNERLKKQQSNSQSRT